MVYTINYWPKSRVRMTPHQCFKQLARYINARQNVFWFGSPHAGITFHLAGRVHMFLWIGSGRRMQLDQVAEAAGLDGRICGRRQSSRICRGSSVNSEDCASRTG